MTQNYIVILAPNRREHLKPLAEMLHNIWTEDSAASLERHILTHSHYDWQASRIALNEKNEILAHWGVWNYTMRIGHADAKVGGVGWVATRRDKRKQGLMTRLGKASLAAMKEAGYDLSTLQGFTHNYARFGYVRAWTYDSYEVALEYLSKPPSHTPLEFQLGKSEEAAARYNKTHEALTGTARKPTYTALPHRTAYRWNAPDGNMTGYVWIDAQADVLICHEAAGDAEETLAVLASLARELKCKRVRFETLHHYHPALKQLRRSTCTRKTNYQNNDGWMVRLIDLQGTLGKMRLELTRRVQRSEFANWRGALSLRNEEDEVTLELDRGHVHIRAEPSIENKIESEAIVQLLIGTDEPLELMETARMTSSGEAKRLCEALFPHQYPSLSSWDMF